MIWAWGESFSSEIFGVEGIFFLLLRYWSWVVVDNVDVGCVGED